MGKSTPKAPAAPDPVATANAQAAANTQAAITQANLNRIDQVTPEGSIKYTQVGTNSDGTPKYQQTQTYSPEQQALYNQQNQIAQSLGGLAQQNIGRVQDAQSKPWSTAGMTPLQSSATTGQLQFGTANPQAQTNVAPAGGIQTSFGTGGPLTSNVQPGQVQGSLNFSGTPAINDNFNATSKAAADAAYSQAASRLDPQFAQQESDYRARLANSGITENSDAYRREMDNFGRQKADAYNQASYSAIAAGLAAQNQGYNQSLSTRQQGVAETTAQGQFANNAQNQQFQQGQQNATLNNAAQGQQFGQNQSAAQFGNQAQDQQYQQNLASGTFYNQGQNQNFNQSQQNAALNNTAQNQQFNQSLANAQLNNGVRQQQIQEAAYDRNLALNDIAALLGTGGGVQGPQFQQFAQVGVAAPDYQGAVYQNYNAANQQYQTAMQNRSAGLGGLFGLAGSLGSAYLSGGLIR